MGDSSREAKRDLGMRTIRMLMVYARHDEARASEVQTIVHHITCGETEIFTKKGIEYLWKRVVDEYDPFLPEDVRVEIQSFLAECKGTTLDALRDSR